MFGNVYYSMLFILIMIIYDSYDQKKKIPIVAHRGASYYAPEHTAAAFDLAVEMGADFIELDIQMSKDGQLIVIHDSTVDRTTDGQGRIQDMTLAQLKKLDAGSWFNPRFINEKILTLKEVIKQYGEKVKFLVEIKDPSLNVGIENRLIQFFNTSLSNGYSIDSFIVQSFDYTILQRLKKAIPSLTTGLLVNFQTQITKKRLSEWSNVVNYINPHYLTVNQDIVNLVHHAKLKIMPWVVNNKEIALYLNDYQIDGIITNKPNLLATISSDPSLFETEEIKSKLKATLSLLSQIDFEKTLGILKVVADTLSNKDSI